MNQSPISFHLQPYPLTLATSFELLVGFFTAVAAWRARSALKTCKELVSGFN